MSIPSIPSIPTLPPRTVLPSKAFSLSGSSVFEGAQARLMGKMDLDGDGGLTAAELAAGLAAGKPLGAVDPAYFAAMDKDSDGKLQLGELQPSQLFSMNSLNALLSQQEAAPAEGRWQAGGIGDWLVSEGDTDGDGQLSAEEFAAVGPAGEWQPGSHPDAILSKADRAFAEADADQDGRVSAGELAKLMQGGLHRVYLGDATNLAPTLVGVADTDGDAAVSLDEARALAPSVEDLDAAFVQGDADGDGKLNAAEMKAMVDARPTLYGSGLLRIDDAPATGDVALRRLLLASLDKVSEAFRQRLDPPVRETTA
jgi:Ca2+-binding EF-hand superfamily protein